LPGHARTTRKRPALPFRRVSSYSEAGAKMLPEETVTRIVPMPPDERYLKQFQ
jgi:hypothetical protein